MKLWFTPLSGLAATLLVAGLPGLAGAQGVPLAPAGGAQPTFGGGLASPTANPFASPYMNPFINPYMTMFPANRTDTLLYLWSAQQAQGGLGSSRAPGGSAERSAPRTTLAPGGSAPGAAAQPQPQPPGQPNRFDQATPRRTAQRYEPARPKREGHVSGRFGDYPSFNNRTGLLSSKFPAFGSVAIDAETGGRVAPGMSPAPNTAVPRYFNHYPSYNGYNGR